MCTCLCIEYCCECNKPDCPHRQPSHRHHHVQDKLFQIDHKAWRYCADFIEVLDSAKQELNNAMPESNTAITAEEECIIRPPKCFKDSTDPRHDCRLPLCKDIQYSTRRVVLDCNYCRDYWIGRGTMENAL